MHIGKMLFTAVSQAIMANHSCQKIENHPIERASPCSVCFLSGSAAINMATQITRHVLFKSACLVHKSDIVAHYF